MNAEIRIRSDAIRKAGKQISKLSVKPNQLCQEELSLTAGLVSSRLVELLSDINEIGSLLQQILDSSPEKLNRIASAYESSDDTSATQFR